ncbi:MAG: tryptophan synthase subunit alpha [Clostridiales bacterium]|nr:tryptophan synthase subunit alpha [Clostridiales bacterium]
MDVILYLSNGYPTIESSIQMAKEYADAGCGMIEIDFPSHDPYLESELIKDRMKKALEACGDYNAYMEEIVRVKKELPGVKLLVLSYENTIMEIGTERFIEFCLKNDFRDVLLVGLSGNEIKDKIIEAGIRVSCYVQYQMLPEEIESAKNSNGFVYLQAKPTPGQGYVNPEYPTLKDCIQGLRSHGIDRPIYCGVGVHSPEDVRMVKEAGGDAAFVGSTILKLQENIPAMKEKIREFVAQCR